MKSRLCTALMIASSILLPVYGHAIAAALPDDTVSREHDLILSDHKTLHYVATAGHLVIRNGANTPTAEMFYVAYTVPRRPDDAERPLMFLFNGGPGSASLWLNIGAFGPVKVPTKVPNPMGGAPYPLVPNVDTLLDHTDIVFIDAVGTGFSHARSPAQDKDFWGVDQDVDSYAKAIERYVDLNKRWNSPRFLLGESYGTTRAAALAYVMHTHNLDLNGVVLLSTMLNFGDERPGTDLNAMNLIPTFAATAWFHGQNKSGDKTLDAALAHAQNFAWGQYARALQQGDRLAAPEKTSVVTEMAALTGIPQHILEKKNLRVDLEDYRRILLAEKGLIIGRFDTRFTGPLFAVSTHPDPANDDPATAGVTSAYYAGFRSALEKQTGYISEVPYLPLHNEVIEPAWDWHHRPPAADHPLSTADTALDLAEALQASTTLHVLVLTGLYDMATPFTGVKYDLAHMGLAPAQQKQIVLKLYPSGHMAYNDPAVLTTMTHDIDTFIDSVDH